MSLTYPAPQLLFENRILFMQAISVYHDNGDLYVDGQSTSEDFAYMVQQLPASSYPHSHEKRLMQNQRSVKDKIRIIGLKSIHITHPESVYWVAIGHADALNEKFVTPRENRVHKTHITLPCNGYELVPDKKTSSWRLTEPRYLDQLRKIPELAGILTEEPFLSNPGWWKGASAPDNIIKAYQALPFRLLRGQIRNLMNEFFLEWSRWTNNMPPSISNFYFLKYLAAANTLLRKASDDPESDPLIGRAFRRYIFKSVFGVTQE
jgi:hypothetical protein